MKPIRKEEQNQVYDQLWDQVLDQVRDQGYSQEPTISRALRDEPRNKIKER